MKTALFRRGPKKASEGDTQVYAGQMTMRILRSSSPPTVAVSGRVNIDSSPAFRSVLLDLLHGHTAPILVIDLSGVRHLDISGIATLLEAARAARECSVKLHAVGIAGQPRMLSELTELDRVFRATGSEVEFS